MKKIYFLILLLGLIIAPVTVHSQNDGISETNYSGSQSLLYEQQLLKETYKPLFFSIYAGYSHLTFKKDNELPNDFYKKLRPGVVIGSNLDYYIPQGVGIGVKFNFRYHKYQDIFKMYNYFIGPHLSYRVFNRNHNATVLSISYGYSVATEKVILKGQDNVEEKGNGGGFNVGIGWDIRIGNNAYWLINLACYLSKPTATINGAIVQSNKSALEITTGFKF